MTDEEMWAATIAVEQAYDNEELSRERAIEELCKLGFSAGEADEHLKAGEVKLEPRPEPMPGPAVLGLRKARPKPVEVTETPVEVKEERHEYPSTGTDDY